MTLTAPTETDAHTDRVLPRIISVDDHVVEPAHLWSTWLPAKYRDRGPRSERKGIGALSTQGGLKYDVVWDDDGPKADCWFYEDLVYINKRHVAAVGFERDNMTMSPITYDEMRPGCYEPKARVEDMEMNWVDASLCFPTFPRFCGQTFTEAKDHEVGLACIKAYNDWMVEEWCGDSGGRLIPLTIIPLWDAELAAAEVNRNAARGVKAVCFSEIPYKLGLPTIHSQFWEPFFQACDDTGTVVCMHIGSSSSMPATSPDAPVAVQATLSFNNAMASLSDFLFSGILVRHPNLKLAFAHAGFDNIFEIGEMETIQFANCRITGVPFTGEHSDLNVKAKTCYHIAINRFSFLFVADSRILEARLYKHIQKVLGDVDVLFLGMECDGAPLTWLYGPLLTEELSRDKDQSRRLSGSDCEKGMSLVDIFNPKEVYVYAMGQEPWLEFISTVRYTNESRPIVQSNMLVAECMSRNIIAERLFGEKELLYEYEAQAVVLDGTRSIRL